MEGIRRVIDYYVSDWKSCQRRPPYAFDLFATHKDFFRLLVCTVNGGRVCVFMYIQPKWALFNLYSSLCWIQSWLIPIQYYEQDFRTNPIWYTYFLLEIQYFLEFSIWAETGRTLVEWSTNWLSLRDMKYYCFRWKLFGWIGPFPSFIIISEYWSCLPTPIRVSYGPIVSTSATWWSVIPIILLCFVIISILCVIYFLRCSDKYLYLYILDRVWI